jgi:hypothetical protein
VFGWIRILWFGVFASAKTRNVRGARASGPIPLWCENGVTTTARILAIIYFTQAAVGIAFGIVYAVRTMYPA